MSSRMPNLDAPKKPAPPDWHPADVKAALEKRGWSLRRLCFANNYSASSLALALRLPWPRAEAIIAAALGLTPQEIWPSRYHDDGTPKSGRGERGLGRYKRKASRPASNHSTAGRLRNVKEKRAV